MATTKRRFRLITVEVTGSSPEEAAQVMSHAVELARSLAADALERSATVKVKGLYASATITINQEGA